MGFATFLGTSLSDSLGARESMEEFLSVDPRTESRSRRLSGDRVKSVVLNPPPHSRNVSSCSYLCNVQPTSF